jgi:hypothetical protein
MRQLVVVVMVLGAVAVAIPGALARTGGASERHTCAATNGLDVYFWPQGHDAVPGIGFGAFPVPHVEFYKPHDATNPAFLTFMGLSTFNFASGCGTVADTALLPAATLTAPSTAQAKIRCTFAGGVDVRTAPLNRVTTRIVRKTIFVRVKGKRVKRIVKRPVRTTTRIGMIATAAITGTSQAIVSVEIKQGSTARWDSGLCTTVALTG